MYECGTARHQFCVIQNAVLCSRTRILEGIIQLLFIACALCPGFKYACFTAHVQEITGIADRVTHSQLVSKDRRCDATFAYQQVMYDVSREILHYTSRCDCCVFSKLIVYYRSESCPFPTEQCYVDYNQLQAFTGW